ncbi:YadA-like family protein [Necropsobacter rosorum]|uniref:YadA-like family protein n=1 Tax=Necropsobacter rosorum TaxID=908285 RepID=UPI003C7B5250
MNKVFKVIWNHTTQSFVVVSELANNRGKIKSSVSDGAKSRLSVFRFAGQLSAVAFSLISFSSSVNAAISMDTMRGLYPYNTGTATAGGTNSIAIGYNSTTTNNDSIAIGTNTSTSGTGTIAFGFNSTASATDSIAIGSLATAQKRDAIAMGYNSTAQGVNSTAIGVNATSNGMSAIAFGYNATATSYGGDTNGATAIGANATATGIQALALGANASANAQQSMAIGNDAFTAEWGAIVIGGDDSNNVYTFNISSSPGYFRDGVNEKYRQSVSSGTGSVVVGVHAQALSQGSTAIGIGAMAGYGNSTSGTTNLSLINSTNNIEATAIGAMASALTNRTTAVGYNTTALGTNSTVVGASSSAKGDDSLALGSVSVANGSYSLAAGYNVTSGNVKDIAIGTNVVAQGGNNDANTEVPAIAIGYNTNVTGDESVAIGVKNTISGTDQNNKVASGVNILGHNNNVANASGVAIIGNNNNVAGAAKTHDVFVLGNNVTTTTADSVFLGSGSAYVAETSTTKGINKSYTSDSSVISGQTLNFAGGEMVAGVVSVGSASAARRVQNVAPGLISATSTDAINGSQLYSVASLLNTKIDNVSANSGVHYFSVNSTGGNNYNNDGAKSADSIAIGKNSTITSVANSGIALGNNSTITDSAKANNTAIGDSSTIQGGQDSLAVGRGATIGNSVTSSAIAIGNASKVEAAQGGIAIGNGSAVGTSANNGAIAIGQQSNVTGISSIALGNNASVTGAQQGSIAIGNNTNVTSTGQSTVAVGSDSRVSVGNAVAVGDNITVNGQYSVALGSLSNVTDNAVSAVAIGHGSNVSKNYGIAIGNGSTVSGDGLNGTALGANASVTVQNGVALGSGSVADRNSWDVAGYSPYIPATADEAQKTAINNTKASAGAVSVGSSEIKRQIINVAAGSADSDAVNVAQLKAAVSDASSAAAWNIQENAVQKEVVRSGDNVNFANGTGTTANVSVDSTGSTATVTYSVNQSDLAVATDGTVSAVKNGDTFATAQQVAKAINDSEKTTTVTGSDKVNVTGTVNGKVTDYVVSLTESANSSLAKADTALQSWTAQVDGQTAKTVDQTNNTLNFIDGKNINITAETNGDIKVSTTDNVTFTTANVTTLNAGGNLLNATGLTVGGVKITPTGINAGDQKIANVANGTSDNDAVNLSQLNATNANVANNSANITNNTNAINTVKDGLNATNVTVANNTQNITNNTNSIQTLNDGLNTTNANVATNTQNITQNTQNISKNAEDIAKGIKFGNGTTNHTYALGDELAVAGDSNIISTTTENGVSLSLAKNITVDSVTAGGNVFNTTGLTVGDVSITAGGIDAGNKTITNVANGTLDTDAVNVSQLNATNANVANNSANITNNTNAINTVKDGLNATNVTVANNTQNITNNTNAIQTLNDGLNTTNANVATNTQNIAKGIRFGNGTESRQYQLGDTLNVTAGNNNIVSETIDGGVQLSLADNISVSSVTAGGNVLNETGLSVGDVKVLTTGIDAGSHKITNVSNGTSDNDAVNLSQLNATNANVANNAQNITNNTDAIKTLNDGLNTTNATVANNTANISNNAQNISKNADNIAKGIKFGNGTTNHTYALGSELAVAGDSNIISTTTENGVSLSLAKNITVDSVAAGGNVFNTTGLTVGDVSITASGIDAGNKTITNVANGTSDNDAVNVSQLNATNANVANNAQNITNNTNTINTVKDGLNATNVTVANNTQNITNNTNAIQILNDGLNTTNTNVATNTQNIAQNAQNIAKGIKFGNGTTNNTYALGSELAVAGDSNIVSSTTENGVSLSLAKNITVDSVTTGGNVLNGTGLTVGDVKVATTGIDAGNKTITNVSNGTSDNDAVNLSQLNATNQTITNLTTQVSGGFGLQAQDGLNVTKSLGEKVEVVGGNDNLNTAVTDGKIAINLNNTLNLSDAGSITIGDSLLNHSGLVIHNGPSITTSGIDAGNQKITNVSNGTSDNDAVNVSQLNATNANVTNNTQNIAQNAQSISKNAEDIAKGIKFGNGTTNNTYALGNELAVVGDSNIVSATTEKGVGLSLAKNITVDSVAAGGNVLNGTGLTVGDVKVATTGIDAGNKTITNLANGTNPNDAATIAQLTASKIALNAGNNTHITSEVAANGTTTYTVDANAATVVNASEAITITATEKANNVTEYAVDLSSATKADITKGVEAKSAVDKGIKFGNGTEAKQYQLGDTLNVTAGNNNIISKTIDGGVQLSLADNINISSVTAGGNVFNTIGLTVGDVKVEATGIDAGNQKIANVANGTSDNDAVNLSQLNATNANVANNSANISNNANAINTVRNDLNATNVNVTNNTQNIAQNTQNISKNAENIAKGINFGNGTEAKQYQLGDTLNVTAGNNNIVSKTIDGGVQLSLADNISVSSVTAGGNVLNGTGLTVGDVKVAATGIDAGNHKITNVSNGTSDNDAVNLSQLNATNQTITNLTTQVSGGFGLQAQDGLNVTKSLGEKVEVVGGNDNLNTAVTDGKIAINLNNTLNLSDAGSITIGDSLLNHSGLVIHNGPSITTSGIDAGNQKITNVSNGTSDTDAVNVSQLNATNVNVTNNTQNIAQNAQSISKNAEDIAKGIKFGNGTTNNTYALGSELAVVGDSNLVSATTEKGVGLSLAKNITVDSVAAGGNVFNTTGLTVGDVKVAATGIDAGNKTITNLANGTNPNDAATIAQLTASKIALNAGNNTHITSEVAENGTTTYTVDTNAATVVNASEAITITATEKANNVTEYAVDLSSATKADITKGVDAKSAVDKGIKFGDGTTAKQYQLGDTLNVTAGNNNIVSETINGGVQLSLVDNISVSSVTAGGNVLNETGLSVGDVKVATTGIDAGSHKITNVSNGTSDTDAVNLSQLNATNANVANNSANITNNANAINTVKDGLNATNATVANNTQNITNNTNAIQTLNDGLNTTNSNVATNTQNITQNTQNISKNAENIAKGIKFGNGTTAKQYQLGDTLNVTAGNNNIVSETINGGVQLSLADNISVSSVTAGGNVFNTTGLTVGDVKVTADGINAGDKKITNVAAGEVSASSTDAVNGSQLHQTNQNVTNLNTEVAKGWTLTTSGNTTGKSESKVGMGAVVTLDGGSNINLTQTGNTISIATTANPTFTTVTTGDATLSDNGLTIANGPNITKSGINAGNKVITNVAQAVNGTDAVNKDQLDAVNATAAAGWSLTVNSSNSSKVAPNATVDLANNDGNIVISKKDNNVLFGLNDALTIGGKAGQDGKIGLDGANGTIGLTGLPGSDGTSASANITVQNGKPGINGKNGDSLTRIVYTDKDGNPHQVATLEDGLKFAGNQGDTIAKQLGETLEVVGALANSVAASAQNIRVDSEGGKLVVKIAENPIFTTVTTGDSVLSDSGLSIHNGPSVTKDGINVSNKQITNLDSGLKDGDNNKVALANASGDMLNNGVNVGDLKEAVSDITSADGNGGFGLTDDNGNAVKQDLGKTIQIKGKDGVTVTADVANKALEVALAGEVSVSGKDGKDGAIGVKGADGKDGVNISGNGTVIAGRDGVDGVDGLIGARGKDGASVVLNGKDGSIGLTGPKGVDGSDGASANISVVNGAKGLDGNDGANGESKTRIVYEKPNGETETVATLNDGLNFTGNNEVVNAHKLNTKVKVLGEGVDKAQSDSFASAAGNINVQANGSDTLTVQLAKNLNLTATGSVTIGDSVLTNNGLIITNGPSITKSGINAGNKVITNVAPGVNGTDAVNKDQLDAVNATAAAGWNLTVNSTDSSQVAPNATVDLANNDGNIVIAKENNNVTFALNENLTIGGKNGKDGIIGVNGKDGKDGVVINGNGSIAINGRDGADGQPGANATLTVIDGQAGINGKSGENLTRIVYTDKDGNSHQVATLEDGLKFVGNQGEVIKKQLGQTLKVAGTLANEALASSANVRVDSENGELVVKIAENPIFNSVITGNSTLNDNGLVINGGPSITKSGINGAGKQISQIDSGLKAADGSKVKLTEASGDVLNNAVNVGDLKDSVSNLTSAQSGGGFGLSDDNGNAIKQDLGNTIQIKGKDGVAVTANAATKALEVGLAGDVLVQGKDGKDGTIGVKGADGKDGTTITKDALVFNGVDGKDGKDGQVSVKVENGAKGLDGNDGANGESKTRIVYEKADGSKEQVATLNDGLNFTGNNEVVNAYKLNSKVKIVGEGVDKAASENFTGAAGNINVKADGADTLTVQLAKDINLTKDGSVTVGDAVVNNNGLTITGGPSVTKDGINVAGKQITGLDSGLKDDSGNKVKLTDATGNMLNNGVNVGDLKDAVSNITSAEGNGGFGLSDDNGNEVKQDLGKTIRIKGKDGVTVTANGTDKALEVGLAGEVSVNGKDGKAGAIGVKGADGKDGVSISGNGSVIAGRDGADGVDGVIGAKGKDGASVVLNGKDGSIGLTGAPGADGKNGASATIQVQNGTTVLDGSSTTRIVYTDGSSVTREVASMDDGLKFAGNNGVVNAHKLNSQVNIVGEGVDKQASDNFNAAAGNINVKANGSDTLSVQLAKDVNLTKAGSVTIGDTKVNNEGLTVQGGPSVTKAGIDAGNTTISNVKEGVNDNDAVTVKQLKANKTKVVAGNNVKVTTTDGANGSAYKVSVEGDLNNIRSIAHGGTKIGLETDAQGRANVNVNNATITNVAPGVNPGDAVNKSQLDHAVNHLGSHINKVDKDLRGGVAGALASAGLYHATLPGRSMVSAGAGAYRGESAVAVGYSRLSDNGKMGVKFSVNTNSRGDTGAAASIGYQW